MADDDDDRGDDVLQTAGLCRTCAQEMLIRTRVDTSGGMGLSVSVRQYTDCACGLRPLAAPEA